MHHALTGVALLQFAQVQPGTKVIALTMQNGRANGGGQVIKGVLQIGEDKSYVNAGSWLRNGNYVMIEQGQVQLREWN